MTRWRTWSSPIPGGTRQSTRTVQREGITFSFSEARIMVGAIVTPIIGSSRAASRGSTSRTRARAAATSSAGDPSRASRQAIPAAYRSGSGWRPSSRPSTSIMRSRALSPIAGIEAWPARPSVESLKRNTPFSPTHSV